MYRKRYPGTEGIAKRGRCFIICKLCKVDKDAYPRMSVCKDCHKLRVKQHYTNNRAAELIRMRNYAQQNKFKQNIAERKYYTKNKSRWQTKRLKRKGQIKGTYTQIEWNNLNLKYGYMCLCCGCFDNISVDHVIPLSKGGNNTIDNVQPLCLTCNKLKGIKIIDYRK